MKCDGTDGKFYYIKTDGTLGDSIDPLVATCHATQRPDIRRLENEPQCSDVGADLRTNPSNVNTIVIGWNIQDQYHEQAS